MISAKKGPPIISFYWTCVAILALVMFGKIYIFFGFAALHYLLVFVLMIFLGLKTDRWIWKTSLSTTKKVALQLTIVLLPVVTNKSINLIKSTFYTKRSLYISFYSASPDKFLIWDIPTAKPFDQTTPVTTDLWAHTNNLFPFDLIIPGISLLHEYRQSAGILMADTTLALSSRPVDLSLYDPVCVVGHTSMIPCSVDRVFLFDTVMVAGRVYQFSHIKMLSVDSVDSKKARIVIGYESDAALKQEVAKTILSKGY